MHDDLSDSIFFDTRTIKFLTGILNNPSMVSPITGLEKKLIANKDQVYALNQAIPEGLIKILEQSKSYVPTTAAVQLLLYANKKDILKDALAILHFAVREQTVLNKKQLQEVLKDSEELPVVWALELISNSSEDRFAQAQKIIRPEGIKLPKDFH